MTSDQQLLSRSLDLAKLQDSVISSFDELARLVSENATRRSAQEARKKIIEQARLYLRSNEQLGSSGIYLFCCLQKAVSDPLIYIGVAKKSVRGTGRTIEDRILDYLSKEYSILDKTLVGMDDQVARSQIASRLRLLHDHPHCDRYTNNHMKSYKIARADSLIYSKVDGLDYPLEEVETALILSANEIQHPTRLVNTRQTRVPPGRVNPAAWQLAGKIIEGWRSAGLQDAVADAWLENISGR